MVVSIGLGGARGAGSVATVDAELAPLLAGPYCVNAAGYPVRRRGGRVVYLHHLVLEAAGVAVPAGRVIDHRNGDKLDNRLENLVVTDYSTNTHNGPGQSRRRSKYRGVSQDRRLGRGRWMAECSRGGVRLRTVHDTEVAAALAYNGHARALYGAAAWQNRVEEAGNE